MTKKDLEKALLAKLDEMETIDKELSYHLEELDTERIMTLTEMYLAEHTPEEAITRLTDIAYRAEHASKERQKMYYTYQFLARTLSDIMDEQSA